MTNIYPKWMPPRLKSTRRNDEAFYSITASNSRSLSLQKEREKWPGLDTIIIACPRGDQCGVLKVIALRARLGCNEMVIKLNNY